MEGYKKILLQEAVSMASWSHNTNVNVLGYAPLQLVTGKNVVFPGLVIGIVATESLYDDEMVRKIMEQYYGLMKEFRESEFTQKLIWAKDLRLKEYEDVLIKDQNLVYYQY